MSQTATIIERIKQKNFCGLAGETEYYRVDNRKVGLVPVSEFRSPVRIGDQVIFDYVEAGNGYRYLPRLEN
jgi:hypothetical protein